MQGGPDSRNIGWMNGRNINNNIVTLKTIVENTSQKGIRNSENDGLIAKV